MRTSTVTEFWQVAPRRIYFGATQFWLVSICGDTAFLFVKLILWGEVCLHLVSRRQRVSFTKDGGGGGRPTRCVVAGPSNLSYSNIQSRIGTSARRVVDLVVDVCRAVPCRSAATRTSCYATAEIPSISFKQYFKLPHVNGIHYKHKVDIVLLSTSLQ